MYVVAVRFVLHQEHAPAFRTAILENASTSLREEHGCQRFDVCFSEDGRECFLYELYSDAAAFRTHLESAHFQQFNGYARAMVESKRVETYLLAEQHA